MYVKNGKISSRQTFRLYVFDLMGIGTLLIPPYLARLCGGGGVYAIALGTLGGVLYLLYLGWIMKRMKKDMASYLHENASSVFGKIMFLFVMLHSLVTAGFCAYVFANLMQYSLVKDLSYFVILFLILGIAAYAVWGGMESRARVYEVLFWFVLIPYVGMMLASARNLEWEYMKELISWEMGELGKGTYLVFLLLTPLFFSLFLMGEKEKSYGRNIVKTSMASVLISSGILLGSYVLLVGNFGVESLGSLRFPVVTLMSTIQFEGNFLKRMDALMLAVWFFTLYALLNLHLHYGVRMWGELRKQQKEKNRGWQLVLSVIVVFLIAYAMHMERAILELFFVYYSRIAVPFFIVSPIVVLVFGRKKNESVEI